MKNMKREQWTWLGFVLGGPTIVVLTVQLLMVRTPLFAPLSADQAHSFLGTMAQVLAGILAIVFSVSVLAVEIASDRYTPRLFSYFRDSPATWLTLASLLVCILLSVVPIGIQAIPMCQLGFLAMSWLFVFCLLMMVYYFRQTLWLLDPRNLAKRIRDEGLQALKKQDGQKVLDAITSLGDVAIKTFERGEDEITKKYLDNLQEIQKDLTTPDSISILIPSSEDKDIISAYFKREIRSPVVDQYYRVFKIATGRQKEEITLYIAYLLYETIITLIEQDGSKEALGGILQQYQEFAKIAVENTDVSRFSLVRYLRQAALPGPYAEVFNEEYYFMCLRALQQANETIIDHQDFELWSRELEYFNSILSVEDIYDSLYHDLGELLRELPRAGISIGREQWEHWNTMVWPMRTRITSTNRRVFELGISQIEHLILASEQQLREKVHRIREALQRLWITTGVYDAFFAVCIYAFYRKQFRFIKELWRYTNPDDASAYWGNPTLIYFNSGFLTHQLVGRLLIPRLLEGHHGEEMYALRYYLLCLAYALQAPNSDWHPTLPHFTEAMLHQGDDYLAAIREELQAVHTFLINLPYRGDKVLAQYDSVASMSEEWDDVFNGRASDALEEAQDWLEDEDRRQGWKEKAESIIRNLPLDNRWVEAYQKAALEYYQSRSRVSQLAITEDNGEKVPTELKKSCHRSCPDKKDFTLIGLGKPPKVRPRGGFEAVHQIIEAEVDHIANTILEHEETRPTRVKKLTFNKVVKAVKKIDEAGYQATTLLAPSQQIHSASQDDPQFKNHLEYGESGEWDLKLDESRKLRIVTKQNGGYAFVLDRKAGNWTTVKTLEIEVTECDKNPLAVQITAQEVVSYQVLNPEAIEILKFRSPRKRKSKVDR